MAITSALSPTVVKTELDGIFVQEFTYPAGPGLATALTPEIFKQIPVDNAAHIEAVLSGGGGYWDERSEQEDIKEGSPRVANKVSYFVVNYAKSLRISKNFFDKLVSRFASMSFSF